MNSIGEVCIGWTVEGRSRTVGYVAIKCHGCFVGPAPSDIPDGVAASPKDQEREVLLSHETDAFGMT